LEITNHCNFRCHFCPLAVSERSPEYMDTKLAKSIIQQLHEHGYRNTLCFHLLGEPFLHPDIDEILEYSSKKTFETLLLTNGSLFTKNNLESAFNNSLNEVVVSMQLTNQGFFHLRGSSINWEHYLSRIRQSINFKLTSNTSTTLRISVGIRKKSIVCAHEDYFPHNSQINLKDDLLNLLTKIPALDSDDVKKKLNSTNIPFTGHLELAPGLSISIKQMGNWRRLYKEKKTNKGYCPYIGNELGVLSNGKLVNCHLDYDGRTSFANANQNRLVDIFSGTEYKKVFEAYVNQGLLSKGCQNCVIPTKKHNKISIKWK
jgi:organic radical activating enzyme